MIKNVILLLICLFTCNLLIAQDPVIVLVNSYSGFNNPIDLANAGDGTDRLFIVEQAGKIKIINAKGNILETPFVEVPKVSSGGERGLLGLAFHPNYGKNGFFFVNFTTKFNGQLHTRIARYSVSTTNPNIADLNSGVTLLEISQPYSNHNAGDLNFGPDGYLYIGMGDGGSGGDPGCVAQDPQSLLGKILRIDVDQNINSAPYFGIPPSNPYVGNKTFDDKIWAIGVRNPWRCSFDRVTGDYWIADVGQNKWEGINKQPANSKGGENYGWKVMEGNNCYDSDPDCSVATAPCFAESFTYPVFEYPRKYTTGGVSVTGGYVYRGCDYPSLYGYYICADYGSNNVWALDSDGKVAGFFSGIGDNISSFGEDETGEIYALSLDGKISRVTSKSTDKGIKCTDSECYGVYIGPEFIDGSDVAHQFSNKMSTAVGDKLKALYDDKKYSLVDFSNIEMTTEGMGTGQVGYALKIPFRRVDKKCDAYTSFDHVGGWNHQPELEKRKEQLKSILLLGEELDISDKKTTKEGLQEYWIQWKNKEKQKECAIK